jgi:hypothetical protein
MNGKSMLRIIVFVLISAVAAGFPICAGAADSGLIGLLTSQLGVSQEQAQGGAGTIFKMAKDGLSEQDYTSLAGNIPGLENMISASPEPEEDSGLLGSISSLFGGSEKLDKMAALKSSFQKLGLSGDMVGQFLPIIYDYVKEKCGEKLMGSLKEALL